MIERTPREALARAIAFFEANPAARIRGYFAKDANNDETDPMSPNATCWCALGRYTVERGIEVEVPRDDGYPDLSLYWDLVREDLETPGHINHVSDIWGPNDDDRTDTGEAIIPVLKSILAKLPA